jgi:alginate O-acetyltransferase complex protein AlgI
VERLWRPLRHAYALAVVMVGWVFFRAETLASAAGFLAAMAGRAAATPGIYTPGWYLTPEVVMAMLAGIVGSTPIIPALAAWDRNRNRAYWPIVVPSASTAALALLLAASILQIAARTYNPFIYFRF